MDLFSFYQQAGLQPVQLRVPAAGSVGQVVWQLLAERGLLPPSPAETLPRTTTGLAERNLPPKLRQAFHYRQITDAQGFALRPEQSLLAGDLLRIYRPISDARGKHPNEVDTSRNPLPALPIIYQDRNLLAVNKPAGLSTTPRGSYVWRSVLVQARLQLGCPQLVAAHRLDRLTSGVLLLIKKPALRATYQRLFDRRQMHKTYYALSGLPATDPRSNLPASDINLAASESGPGQPLGLAQSGSPAQSLAHKSSQPSKIVPPLAAPTAHPPILEAVTTPSPAHPSSQPLSVAPTSSWGQVEEWHWLMRKLPGRLRVAAATVPAEILAAKNPEKALRRHPLGKAGWRFTETRAQAQLQGEYLRWKLEPVSGFTHQLRVALQARGCPILGDPLYGNHPGKQPQQLQEAPEVQENLALHCAQLRFTDPLSGQEIKLVAPRPL